MRLRKFLTAVLPLVLLAALVGAGCGGGGDDTTVETQETTAEERTILTKAELISQGDAICGEVNAAVGAIGADEEGEIEEQTIEVANLYVGMVASLQALGRPSEPEGYDEFWAAAEEFAKVEGEVKLAAEREESEALGEAATAAAPALEEFQAQAAIYGMEECSEQPSAPPVTGTGGGAAEGEVEEGGVEVTPEIEEEILPEEEVAPEEEIAPEGGGVGGEEEVAPEGGEEGSSGGGIGPG
ncbi:MAG: hypothetical protein QOE75_1558 [Solirubrobacterales bacterium]|jgi:hypothetical protein|nr:hypothetical protein [Solirubrobacterales bacterium]